MRAIAVGRIAAASWGPPGDANSCVKVVVTIATAECLANADAIADDDGALRAAAERG